MPDYLYIIIASSICILTVLLAFALVYLVIILRGVTKVVEEVDDTVEKVQNYILKPLSMTNQLVHVFSTLLDNAAKKIKRNGKKE